MAVSDSETGQRASKSGDGQAEDPSRGKMQEQLKGIERFAIQLIGILSVAISLFSIAAFDPKRDVWFIPFVFSVYVGEAVAAILLGGLLGFVFGIPRFLRVATEANKQLPPDLAKDAPASANAKALRSFAGNTNLEEISDWLTKIFVGLGLTQATTIYGHISALTNAFEKSVMGRGTGAGVFFVVVLLASTVGGFLFFYIETRTRITLLLTDADVAAGPPPSWTAFVKEAMQAPLNADNRYSAKTLNLTEAQQKADRELLSVPFSSLRRAGEFAGWAAAQARANNRQAASRAISEAVTLDPRNADYLATMAEIRLQLGNPQGAVDAYSEMREKGQIDGTTLRRELLSTLYLASPESFRRALAVADKLFEVDPGAKSDAQVQTWLAAAYGQQYTWLSQNSGTDPDMKAARDSALAAAKNVVLLEPEAEGPSRKLLARLLDPSRSRGSSDDDLYIFQNDEEFRKVILGEDKATSTGSPTPTQGSPGQKIDGSSLRLSEPDAPDHDEPRERLSEEDQ